MQSSKGCVRLHNALKCIGLHLERLSLQSCKIAEVESWSEAIVAAVAGC